MAEKPTRSVTGKIQGRILIGQGALIQSKGRTEKTSPVRRYLIFKDGRIFLETDNDRIWIFPSGDV